jgi:hypothetical protein
MMKLSIAEWSLVWLILMAAYAIAVGMIVNKRRSAA